MYPSLIGLVVIIERNSVAHFDLERAFKYHPLPTVPFNGAKMLFGICPKCSNKNRLYPLTHLGTGDGAERIELFTKFLIIDGVIKILDIQVYTL